jgi:hypothetical protein
MSVAQRGAAGSVGAGLTAYTVDGWQVTTAGAAAAWSQQYNANLVGTALRINCAAGLSAALLQQCIESSTAAELLAVDKTPQALTVQFAIANFSGAAITPQIATDFATAQDNFAGVTADLASTNLQTIANGAIATVAYSFTPSASLALGYRVRLRFLGQLNASSGYVDISRADIHATPGVATGINAAPPAPDLRPLWTEMLWCRAFYRTTYANGVAPGTSVGLGGMVSVLEGNYTNPNYFSGGLGHQFDPPMRATPTMSFWDAVGNAGKASLWWNGLQTDNIALGGAFVITASGFYYKSVLADAQTPAAFGHGVHYAMSAEL